VTLSAGGYFVKTSALPVLHLERALIIWMSSTRPHLCRV
jgi:hypothetical protein